MTGDSTVANALNFSLVLESLAKATPNFRANLIRMIGLELERIATHTGDLSALANDVAYLIGNSVFGACGRLL